MTFRIDEVKCRNGVWIFSIKGVIGAGVYGALRTGGQGRGLYPLNAEPCAADGETLPLIPPNEFVVPADASVEEASRLLAAGLRRLGWGAEVDQRNRVLGTSPTDALVTPFGAVTSEAKQANCDHDWQPDGQTLTAVRWTCSKCFKTELR